MAFETLASNQSTPSRPVRSGWSILVVFFLGLLVGPAWGPAWAQSPKGESKRDGESKSDSKEQPEPIRIERKGGRPSIPEVPRDQLIGFA